MTFSIPPLEGVEINEILFHAKKNFIINKGQLPEIIIMHPLDSGVYIDYHYKKTQMCAMENLLTFQNLKIIESSSIEKGTIQIF